MKIVIGVALAGMLAVVAWPHVDQLAWTRPRREMLIEQYAERFGLASVTLVTTKTVPWDALATSPFAAPLRTEHVCNPAAVDVSVALATRDKAPFDRVVAVAVFPRQEHPHPVMWSVRPGRSVPGWFNNMRAVVAPPILQRPLGTFVVWPVDNPPAPTRTSALAVARDFSTRALGLEGNAIVVDLPVVFKEQPELSLEIPANHIQLRVVAGLRNGGWGVIQVGNNGGMSFSRNGPFGQTNLHFQPPAGATSATMTELADDGLHHTNLNEADLHTGTAFLACSSPHSVLVVFANAAGLTLGADGGTF
jgi:hypothetical protein